MTARADAGAGDVPNSQRHQVGGDGLLQAEEIVVLLAAEVGHLSLAAFTGAHYSSESRGHLTLRAQTVRDFESCFEILWEDLCTL